MSLEMSIVKSSAKEHSPIRFGGQIHNTFVNIHHDQEQQSDDAVATPNSAFDKEIIYKERINSHKLKNHITARKVLFVTFLGKFFTLSYVSLPTFSQPK